MAGQQPECRRGAIDNRARSSKSRGRPRLLLRTLCALLTCLLLVGCSTVGKQATSGARPSTLPKKSAAAKAAKKQDSWFGSLFASKDPPPKSPGEWMRETKPLRLNDTGNR